MSEWNKWVECFEMSVEIGGILFVLTIAAALQ